MGMIDVGDKPVVLREAVATGRIVLSAETMDAIRGGSVRKGDPIAVAEVAAMQAAKQTSLLIPHCHQVPLDTVDLEFSVGDYGVQASCRVKARARTGVEMEALIGVSAALCTIWDMVKYLEKDPEGQYPKTRVTDVRVIKKAKDIDNIKS
jgi:cyclic pyranopterin monophosphate synthase